MAVIFLNRMRFMKPFYFTHDDGPPILPGMQQEPEVTASQSRPGHGLNRPGLEHDACGVGFLAEMEGRPSGRVMPLALTALARLGHRGAVDADGRTGDGAGVTTQIPYAVLQPDLDAIGFGQVNAYEPQSPADPVFNLRRVGGGKGHLWRLFRTKAEAIVYMVESFGRESEGAEWARALGIDSFEDLVSRYSSAPGEPPP